MFLRTHAECHISLQQSATAFAASKLPLLTRKSDSSWFYLSPRNTYHTTHFAPVGLKQWPPLARVPCLNRISPIAPLKNGPKQDARGPDRVEIHRKIMPGIKLAARYQHALDHVGSYPNSNRRPIVSDVSLVR